ncbi:MULTISPECIES: M48 family metalloprotease [unclassified Coleofasciculus]|uniref:M48 family metalloprotease n=1 Tax=unclassified Coleofasciculus TaxID=2692782 RepID=UPI001881D776|nr:MULTISPECIES: M48 family metallopeptidase [unclassified Coleofasciculus]MBE9125532.1 M48 family metalloprotease [Coleofasciculus sp. LEGE 07081]MBE9148604.1 M48 family metalloprotease [Coleofasciculus sp. LEGE 07092]
MSKLLVRLVLGLVFAVFGLLNYCGTVSENPITGESQRVALSVQQEIVLGRQGRQEVAAQFGGLYPNEALQNYIDQVGQQVVDQSEASSSPYPFEFHLLDAPETVNAFALPGGQIFITSGLLSRLNSEAQLAGVLGHEVGHVVARHGAEHLARRQLGAALVNAIAIASSDNPQNARQTALIAQAVNQLVNLNYSRDDELESDRLGFQFMTAADYNPQGIVELMAILNEAQSGGRSPEFLNTHPNPSNRIARLEKLINDSYPNGIPPSLEEGERDFAQIVQPQLR